MKVRSFVWTAILLSICMHSGAQEIKVFKKGDRYGYKKNGKVFVEPMYGASYEFSDGRGLVWKDNKFGYLNEEGSLVIPMIYKGASPFENGFAVVDSAEYSTMIDVNGNKIFPFKYEYIRNLTNGYFKVEQKGRYGIINASGKEIAPCRYTEILLFSNGFVKVRDTYGNIAESKSGLIRLSDGKSIPVKYSEFRPFSEGMAACSVYDEVAKTFYWGFIDSLGNEVVKPVYEQVIDYSNGVGIGIKKGVSYYFDNQGETPENKFSSIAASEGLAVVRISGKYGYVNSSNDVIIPIQFEDAWKFKNGLARVRKNGKFGFIDKSGKEVIPIIYEDAGFPGDQGVWVKQNNKFGYVDLTGKELIPAEFEDVLYKGFINGIAKVKLGNREWGFIDIKGNAVNPSDSMIQTLSADQNLIPFKNNDGLYGFKMNDNIVVPARYNSAHPFVNGLAIVRIGSEESGIRGAIDRFGNEVIPLRYTYLGRFVNGLAPVKNGASFGYIDEQNKLVINRQFDIAMDFEGNRAIVVHGTLDNGNWNLIDKTGKIVTKRSYGRIYTRSGIYFEASRDMKFVFIDTLGNEVSPLYDEIGTFSSGLAPVGLNGKYGYIDKSLKVVIPLKYDDAFTFQYEMGKVKLNGEYFYVDVNGTEKRINNFGNIEMTCTRCNSTGKTCSQYIPCAVCSGTGNSYESYRCSMCGGDGLEKEQKRTDYVNFQTGQRFGSQLNLVKTGRNCKYCNGTGKFSSSQCSGCNGKGGTCFEVDTCPDCKGSGKVKIQ